MVSFELREDVSCDSLKSGRMQKWIKILHWVGRQCCRSSSWGLFKSPKQVKMYPPLPSLAQRHVLSPLLPTSSPQPAAVPQCLRARDASKPAPESTAARLSKGRDSGSSRRSSPSLCLIPGWWGTLRWASQAGRGNLCTTATVPG